MGNGQAHQTVISSIQGLLFYDGSVSGILDWLEA
jgi:hypothetical protein